ncbi:MAG TPA: response regulator [Myxococcota bacterium]|jgi:CheY-like chemotaxis protein
MPKTLLLADDSVTIQKVVGISFASEDIKLVTVDNGTAAIAKAKELRPDIVLADVVMPGLNGYEVCRQIKADPALRHIPVLLLTGTFEAFDEARAREAGSDGHITKPFEAQALVDFVNARLAAAAPRPPAASAPAPAPAKSAVGGSPLFGEEEPFDFMSDEVTEPSGVRAAAARADDALSFGAAEELEVNANDDLAEPLEVEALTQVALTDADSGVVPLADDDENAETLPPVDAGDSLEDEDALGTTSVLFGDADESPAPSGDAFASTRVMLGEPEAAGVGTITPGDAGAAADPLADLIGGGAANDVTPTDLGDPFADGGSGVAPAVTTTVMSASTSEWPAQDDEPFAASMLDADDDAPAAPAPTQLPSAGVPSRDELRNLLEKMAWEAFGDVTDRIVRETVQRIEQVAWEVIPKMAETMIREEIRKLKESDEQ